MGSIGLTVSHHQPSLIIRPTLSNNKYSHQNHHHPQTLPHKSVGSNLVQVKTNKVSNFCIVKALSSSSEGPTTSMSTVIEKLGVKIESNPPESRLSELGVRQWPKWGCPPSRFPWTYDAKETCYLLQGKVKVYPDGSNEAVEIGPGDLVVFPKGMKCTWDVAEAVDKHYNFE